MSYAPIHVTLCDCVDSSNIDNLERKTVHQLAYPKERQSGERAKEREERVNCKVMGVISAEAKTTFLES